MIGHSAQSDQGTEFWLKDEKRYNYDIHYYSDQYFRLYYFVNENNGKELQSKELSVMSERIGFNGELKITKTITQLLSTPHMERCQTNGEYIEINTVYPINLNGYVKLET